MSTGFLGMCTFGRGWVQRLVPGEVTGFAHQLAPRSLPQHLSNKLLAKALGHFDRMRLDSPCSQSAVMRWLPMGENPVRKAACALPAADRSRSCRFRLCLAFVFSLMKAFMILKGNSYSRIRELRH